MRITAAHDPGGLAQRCSPGVVALHVVAVVREAARAAPRSFAHSSREEASRLCGLTTRDFGEEASRPAHPTLRPVCACATRCACAMWSAVGGEGFLCFMTLAGVRAGILVPGNLSAPCPAQQHQRRWRPLPASSHRFVAQTALPQLPSAFACAHGIRIRPLLCTDLMQFSSPPLSFSGFSGQSTIM